MAARRVRLLRDRLRDPIERHRHHHDHDAGEQCERRVGVEAARDDVAEPLAADQSGDDDHRQREEDRLVDGQEQHPSRQREPYLREHLRRRGAHRERGLDGVRRDAANPERRDANRGRDRVDHRRDHRSARADGEEDHHGHQVRERRDDLHRVEHRRDGALEPVGEPREHPERDPDEEGEPDRRQHQRERLHALDPEAARREGDEGGERPDGGAHAPEAQRHENARGRHAHPGHPPEEAREPLHEIVEEPRKAVERADHHARALRVALVDEPGLEVVQVRRQRVPRELRRPGVARREGEVAHEHHADDPRRERHPAAPPRPVLDKKGRRGRRGRGVGDDGHVSRLRRRSPRAPRCDRRRRAPCRSRRRPPVARWTRSRGSPA